MSDPDFIDFDLSVLLGIFMAMMVLIASVLYILVCVFRLMQWWKRRSPKSSLPIADSRVSFYPVT